MQTQWSGKPVIVTGASRGIGRAVCAALAEGGAKVVLIGRDRAELARTRAMLQGEGHLIYAFDLGSTAGMEALMGKITLDAGEPAGLVYCAGISPVLSLEETTPERSLEIMTVNYLSFLEMARHFAGGKTGPGGVIGISSIRASVGEAGDLAYCASKAAMEGAIRTMAKELAGRKITVNAVAPGFVATRMYDAFVEQEGQAGVDALLQRQFLGVVQPCQIAEAVLFLLGCEAVTGTVLTVDAGYTAN